ncbi:zinc-dependent metalloprotease family protein [Aeromonas sp. A-5]|uniref:zinc-dependent metalloprotease family protein n=1 Tax=Aeromonas ichthyocola TaxID=3367746 RepID=UPI0038DFBC09
MLTLAAITTLLNRVNEVYQRDVGAEFQLASRNDNMIFTDPASDPFDNTDADADHNVDVQAQAFADGDLGTFDIGHVLNTGGGGLASLGVLCVDTLPPYYAYGANHRA